VGGAIDGVDGATDGDVAEAAEQQLLTNITIKSKFINIISNN